MALAGAIPWTAEAPSLGPAEIIVSVPQPSQWLALDLSGSRTKSPTYHFAETEALEPRWGSSTLFLFRFGFSEGRDDLISMTRLTFTPATEFNIFP